jgi:hypothetical protein
LLKWYSTCPAYSRSEGGGGGKGRKRKRLVKYIISHYYNVIPVS